MKFLRIAVYCLAGGLVFLVGAQKGSYFSWWLAGILFATAFVPLALKGPKTVARQFGVILPVFLLVTVLCLWSEALIFTPMAQPHPVRDLVAESIMFTVFAAVLAGLAVLLKLPGGKDSVAEVRSPAAIAVLILICGCAYAFYYLVFGGITYQFFTKQYYPDAPGQVMKLGAWFWPMQIGRGAVMTLAVLPVVRSVRLSRWKLAITLGLMIWIVGGLAPLVLPSAVMEPRQRFIHVIEIFTQNFSLGVTAGWLLTKKRQSAASPVSDAAVAA